LIKRTIRIRISKLIKRIFNKSLDYQNIRENDIYKVEDEKVKVLSIDKLSSRIKVLREYNSTVGSAHTASTVLYEQTRKFTINLNKNTNIDYNLNKEIYFNPVDHVNSSSRTSSNMCN
jgi:hypothetical protein